MRSHDDVDGPGRAPSLRRFAIVSTALFAALTVVVVIALVWTSILLDRSVATVVRDARSQRIAAEIEVELLMYQRIRNLRALTGEEELDRATAPMVAAVWDLVAQAEAYAGSERERGRIRTVSRRIGAYLEERRRLESARLDVEDIIRNTQPNLDALVADLEDLRDLNDAQVEQAHADAERWVWIGNLVGFGAGAMLMAGLLLATVGVRRHLLRPLLELHDAIERFSAGQTDARVEAGGFREMFELARGYNQMAEALERQREGQLTFLAGVAHDLRNPLSGLKLGLHALEQEPQSEASRSRTQTRLDRQVDRLARMVEDLLDATRIEAGKLEIRSELLDLRDIVEDMVRLYAPTSPDHQIKAELPEAPVTINGDPLRIEQVVSNLLSNAIKFSPRGGTVDVTVAAESTEAVLSVTDHGMGISPDELPTIFLPFRRRRGDIIPGAGLGLSVVRRIVDAHGGRIEVDSEPGTGTTFRITLPLAAATAPTAPTAATAATAGG